MLIDDGFFVLPAIRFDLHQGSLGMGVCLPWAIRVGENVEPLLGNPVLQLMVQHCQGQEWSVCAAGTLAVGAGVIYQWNDRAKKTIQGAASQALASPLEHAHMHLVMQPGGAIQVIHQRWFAQAELGLAMGTYRDSDTCPSMDVGLQWAAAVGYRWKSWLQPTLEVRGFGPLKRCSDAVAMFTEDFAWLGIGFRFYFPRWSPVLSLGLPLSHLHRLEEPFRLQFGMGVSLDLDSSGDTSVASGAEADDSIVPLGLEDTSSRSALVIGIPMLVGWNPSRAAEAGGQLPGYGGAAPYLGLRYASDWWSLRAAWSAVFYTDSQSHVEARVGNPVLGLSGRRCWRGEPKWCAGAAFAFGAGVIYTDDQIQAAIDPSLSETDAIQRRNWLARAQQLGTNARQDTIYHAFEHLTFQPLGFITLRSGKISAQAEVGANIGLPAYRSMCSQTEFGLLINASVGYRWLDWLIPIAEARSAVYLRRCSYTSNLVTDFVPGHSVWMNLGARFPVGPLEPSLRAGFALYQPGFFGGRTLTLEIGATYRL
jgi:hypothetical protein